MIKNFNNYKQTCNIICAVLTLVLIVLMFMPFWVIPEQEIDASIADYLWFPTDHEALEDAIKDWNGLSKKADYVELKNDIVLGLFFSFVLGAVGVVIGGVIKRKTIVAPLFGAVAGVWMTALYVSQVAFSAAYVQNYGLHLAVAVVTAVASVGTLALYVAQKIYQTREKNKKYKQYRQ